MSAAVQSRTSNAMQAVGSNTKFFYSGSFDRINLHMNDTKLFSRNQLRNIVGEGMLKIGCHFTLPAIQQLWTYARLSCSITDLSIAFLY